MHFNTSDSEYSASGPRLIFNLEIDGEDERIATLMTFCETHLLFTTLGEEFFGDDLYRYRRLMIRNTRRCLPPYVRDMPDPAISVPEDTMEQLDKLLHELIAESSNISYERPYRFEVFSLDDYADVYGRLVELVGERFRVKPLGTQYNYEKGNMPYLFEVTFDSRDDALKLKLTHNTFAEAIRGKK